MPQITSECHTGNAAETFINVRPGLLAVRFIGTQCLSYCLDLCRALLSDCGSVLGVINSVSDAVQPLRYGSHFHTIISFALLR